MKKNKFGLSNEHDLTGNMGMLIPINVLDVVPADVVQMSSAILVRLNGVLRPLMTQINARIHHWFVPNRLIWEDWEDFITGGPDGTDSSVHPYIAISGDPGESSLLDYMGVPPGTYASTININALPIRAYNLIWNENYRDQQLQNELTIDLTDGQDTTSNTTLQSVNWNKGYFTTCRSAPALGDSITIPLSGDAPVTGIGVDTQSSSSGPLTAYETDGAAGTSYADYFGSNTLNAEEDPLNAGYPNIRADLELASGMDINELRLAIKLQEIQERRNVYGSRYVEYLLSEFGVRSSDRRLNNPEFLGGGRRPLVFSEVVSTDGANTGDQKGHGIGAIRSNTFRRHFEEFGLIISLLSVVPKTVYSQGIERMFTKTTKEDYFNRSLQVIGEQEVLNKELYVDHTTPEGTFGYQARYDEYRSKKSQISGEFHSTHDEWHAARIFASDPALNSSFITCVPTKRYLADTSNDSLYIKCSNRIVARRPMMVNARPMTF